MVKKEEGRIVHSPVSCLHKILFSDWEKGIRKNMSCIPRACVRMETSVAESLNKWRKMFEEWLQKHSNLLFQWTYWCDLYDVLSMLVNESRTPPSMPLRHSVHLHTDRRTHIWFCIKTENSNCFWKHSCACLLMG